MNDTEKPVTRLTAASILRSFQISGKKHLFLTGARKAGKSTLAKSLVPFLAESPEETDAFLPGITTNAVPGKQVLLTENGTSQNAVIGIFADPDSPERMWSDAAGRVRKEPFPEKVPCPQGNRMRPVPDGFLSLGIPALSRAAAKKSEWICIDELGYLETSCRAFQDAVYSLLEKKHVLAVIRKQETPFLASLLHRSDAFVIDLDSPIVPIGCVIMASGLSRRFGSNKLLADFHGKPLIAHALAVTGPLAGSPGGASFGSAGPLLARRIVVTRTLEVQKICRTANIPVLLHNFPNRSDTVRLGIRALSAAPELHAEDIHTDTFLPDAFSTSDAPLLTGYLFCPGDQPLLSRESLETLCLTFSQNPDCICRLGTKERPGAPVIFPARLSKELLTLPKGKGGSFLTKKYPEQVRYVPVRNDFELLDADTPETLAALARISL